ncbi:class I SAM-dependent methyltransferase [Candidatus Woesearchaeota archaeon]|jgi:hypothetical protein|nr:class I SAM-dependent methyltransferase [Candidatus Woesearchaeota archaeon]
MGETKNNISLIYRKVWLYRLIMNLLYKGGYNRRFDVVIKYIDLEKGDKVAEFCFGDTHIAKYCYKNGVDWVGYDFNPNFIRYAKQNAFNAYFIDLLNPSSFSQIIYSNDRVDVAIMMGSLYHFHDNIGQLIHQIMAYCNKFVISEPVGSLSNLSGPIGWLAKRSANAGHGNEAFRYDTNTLLLELEGLCRERYKLTILEVKRDLICQIEWK